MNNMNIRKAIFALNSKKDRAFLIEEIPLNTAPTPDAFVWWAGVQLVVATTDDDVVDWFIDGNAFMRIVEEEPNEYHIMRVEHAPHILDKVHDFQWQAQPDGSLRVQDSNGGGNISGCTYTTGNCACTLNKPAITNDHTVFGEDSSFPSIH